MAHGWLLLLTPVAAEVLGRCALQRHATRTRPLILEEHGASGNWSYVLDSCQRLVEFRERSFLSVPLSAERLVPLAAAKLLRAQASAPQGDMQRRVYELRALEAHRWARRNAELTLFNPSLVALPETWRQGPQERWLAAFRHMEVTEERGEHCAPLAVSSVVVLAVLDQALQPTRPLELVTYDDLFGDHVGCQDARKRRKSKEKSVALGPEDARLMALNDGVFIFFDAPLPLEHIDFCPGHTFWRMFVAEVFSDLRVHGHHFELRMESEVELHEAPRVGPEAFGKYEKNWSPFIYSNESGQHLMMQQSIEPHVVMSMDHQFIAGKEVYNSSSEELLSWLQERSEEALREGLEIARGSLHGGVSPLLWPKHLAGLSPPFYLSVLHMSRHDLSYNASYAGLAPWESLDYMSFFFAFEAHPPFRLLRVGSKALPLTCAFSTLIPHVAFPTQLLPMEQGLKLLYGKGDAAARSWTVTEADLEEYLSTV